MVAPGVGGCTGRSAGRSNPVNGSSTRDGRSEATGKSDDPFDRLLMAQARHLGLTVVTADADLARYDVHTIVV